MANTLIKDVHTLVDNVVEETDMLAGWSKSLPTFAMSDVDGQRYEDIEYLPEDFRFIAEDGYVSQSDNSDAQSLTDRLIPIRRDKSFYIKSSITTKELRDPRLRKMAADGFAREIRNKIDTYCYLKTIQKAQMVQELAGSTAAQEDLLNAEVLMMDNGLSMYNKNIFLSLPHYKDLGATLANNPQYSGMPETAYKRGVIPNQVGGFDMAMRADYRQSLAATTASGITVDGEQQYQVTTKDGNDQYVDNREMSLTLSSTTNVNVGDKFTIAGVNRVNPEVREDTGELMTFTVLSVTNGTTMVISPAIITDDATNSSPAYQNVSDPAADSAAITFLNITTTRYPSIFYAQDSIKIIPGNLPVPSDAGGVEKVDATTEQGLPMRFTYWYDPDAEVMYMKAVVFFDLEVWLPNQVGVLI
jgi:hypothetical protein